MTFADPDREARETGRALRAKVWADAPTPTGLDTVADVRAMRDEDNGISDRQSAARSVATTSEDAGERLLAFLGLG